MFEPKFYRSPRSTIKKDEVGKKVGRRRKTPSWLSIYGGDQRLKIGLKRHIHVATQNPPGLEATSPCPCSPHSLHPHRLIFNIKPRLPVPAVILPLGLEPRLRSSVQTARHNTNRISPLRARHVDVRPADPAEGAHDRAPAVGLRVAVFLDRRLAGEEGKLLYVSNNIS